MVKAFVAHGRNLFEVIERNRVVGRAKRRYKDSIKMHVKLIGS